MFVYIGGGGLNLMERRNLQKSYTKCTAEWQAVAITELDTTQRAIGVLCADLNNNIILHSVC